jgi:hypothetical protein
LTSRRNRRSGFREGKQWPAGRRDLRAEGASLSDYIVMLHPDIDRNTVHSAANIAVKAAQDDAVKVLIDLRSGNQGK